MFIRLLADSITLFQDLVTRSLYLKKALKLEKKWTLFVRVGINKFNVRLIRMFVITVKKCLFCNYSKKMKIFP